MDNINKYLKIAKNVVIKPDESNIEDKIINRLTSVDENDKKMLDDSFLDYVRKSNSRFYLFIEKIRDNPGKVTVLFMFILLFAY
ncbi:MAG: hypothetical protein M1308_05890 [Actinobacteria bacterium]|nr:hypothetical protein [Actinomycetota bacterium]